MFIHHVADYLKKDVNEIRRVNFYRNGYLTHFNQPLEEFYFDHVWEDILHSSEFEKRRDEIVQFNSQNKYRKRGISLLPTKYVTFLSDIIKKIWISVYGKIFESSWCTRSCLHRWISFAYTRWS